MLGGSGGRGSRRPRGLRKSRPQEFGASTPYKDICSASQWAAGAAPSPVPGRPPQPVPLPVPPVRLSRAMSSTQFNKGPSYGLSAEVKNRVSGRGAAQPDAAAGPAWLCFALTSGGLGCRGELRRLGGWGPTASASPGVPSSPAPAARTLSSSEDVS